MDRKSLALRKRVARLFAAAVHRHQGESGDRLEDVAAVLGISGGHLHNLMVAERDLGIPADLVVRWSREFGDHSVIAGLCGLCGGEFVPGALFLPGREAVLRAAGEAGVDAAGVVAEFLGAVADGVVTREELARLEESVPHAAAGLGALVGVARGLRTAGSFQRAASLAEAEQ